MVKPEKVFKMGGVRASVFRNTIQRNGQAVDLPKVVIEVRYRDKNGQWQGTNSLSLNDLPKAVTANDGTADHNADHASNGHRYILRPPTPQPTA